MRRESDELFVKELIPPLIFSLAFEVSIEGGISDLVAIREELMIATKNGKWLIVKKPISYLVISNLFSIESQKFLSIYLTSWWNWLFKSAGNTANL